jgi:hypothetical protein
LSSALLFAAIVALWAGALVPLWLRRDAAREDNAGTRDFPCRPDVTVAEGTTAEPGHSRQEPVVPGEDCASRTGGSSFSAYERGAPGNEPGMRNAGTCADGREHEPPMSSHGLPAVPVPLVSGPAVGGIPAAGTPRASAPRDSAPPGSAPRGNGGRERGSQNPPGARPQRGGTRPGGARPGDTRVGRYRDERRARIMAARRRLLMMLVALTGLAVAFAVFRVASWWVVAAPALLLLTYLTLLREASRMDAELRQRHTHAHPAAPARAARAGAAAPARGALAPGRAAAAAPGPAAATPGPAAAGPGRTEATAPGSADAVEDPAARNHSPAIEHGAAADADVVVIPPPTEDELYDQYADARLRAVGD